MESKIIKRRKNWKLKISIIEVIALALFIISLFLFTWKRFFSVDKEIDAELWAQFGDFIGGIIGTLIAYISVRLLVKTLNIQIKANKETSEINRKTAEVYELQQFNEMFNILFSLYKKVKDSYCNENEKCLYDLVEKIKNDNKDKFNAITKYEELNKKAIKIYETFYADNQNTASTHFRLLYRIFKLIDSVKISDDNRIAISKTIRSQLTEEELFLLRYNAMSKCGEKMQDYINQYNLLKHLPLLSILEFTPLCQKLDKAEVNSINVEFQILSKNIRKLFLDKSNNKKNLSPKLSNNYQFKISVSSDNKELDIELIKNNKTKFDQKTATNIESALNKLNEDEVKNLLLYYCEEFFIFSNFQSFNKLDELICTPEITNKSESKKVTISVNIKNKEGYELICSKRQLDNPR